MGSRISPDRATAIRLAVASSKSIAGTLRALMMRVGGANYSTIHRAIQVLRLDTSHWTGQGHRKGVSKPTVPARSLAQILVKGTTPNTAKLRVRLIAEGVLEAKCLRCGLVDWQGFPIPLELDHVDGDRTNNELLNLRLLCPNCHALTPTYRGRNIKAKRLGNRPNQAK